ncbi:growth/differentiation factor 8-like [Bicyclus anynana]|uniref:Growth/differentiation factor 8-like n=1 Tax=Bicyclus anynana TaxID=110368 RepID=A0ABM3M1N0_BICAN|nr:growth/differentiation factor 8-like [Bicyclus anynana]
MRIRTIVTDIAQRVAKLKSLWRLGPKALNRNSAPKNPVLVDPPLCEPTKSNGLLPLDAGGYIFLLTDASRHNRFKGLKVINFKFTNKVLQNEVDEAFLSLHIQELEARNNVTLVEDHYTVNIQVNRVTRNSQGKASVTYADSPVKLSRKDLKVGKWLKVNVTNMVAEFFRLPRENLAIVVRIQDSKNRLSLVVPHPSSESNNALMPYIEVSLRDNSHKRTRRMIGMDCTENLKEVRCCRYPLSVNFEEFGWDWIIAPKQYDANYCSGECPYSFLQKYPHTHLVHLAAPQGNGGPCCAPRKMSSISMLYFDHDLNIIYGTIPGMVVESCGCS